MNNKFRHITVAAIHVNGCTTSTQLWTNDRSEAMEKMEQFVFEGMQQRNPVILAAICDPNAGVNRYNVCDLRATLIV